MVKCVKKIQVTFLFSLLLCFNKCLTLWYFFSYNKSRIRSNWKNQEIFPTGREKKCTWPWFTYDHIPHTILHQLQTNLIWKETSKYITIILCLAPMIQQQTQLSLRWYLAIWGFFIYCRERREFCLVFIFTFNCCGI